MKTPGEKMLARLRAVGKEKSPLQNDHPALRVEAEHEEFRLMVEFEDIDKIGLRLRRFGAQKASPFADATFDLARLRRQADEVVRRVSYLTEDVALIELDEKNGQAQVRSARGKNDQKNAGYYEILLNGNDSLSFCRYKIAGDNSRAARSAVPIIMTHDIFERLVNDLAAVLSIA